MAGMVRWVLRRVATAAATATVPTAAPTGTVAFAPSKASSTANAAGAASAVSAMIDTDTLVTRLHLRSTARAVDAATLSRVLKVGLHLDIGTCAHGMCALTLCYSAREPPRHVGGPRSISSVSAKATRSPWAASRRRFTGCVGRRCIRRAPFRRTRSRRYARWRGASMETAGVGAHVGTASGLSGGDDGLALDDARGTAAVRRRASPGPAAAVHAALACAPPARLQLPRFAPHGRALPHPASPGRVRRAADVDGACQAGRGRCGARALQHGHSPAPADAAAVRAQLSSTRAGQCRAWADGASVPRCAHGRVAVGLGQRRGLRAGPPSSRRSGRSPTRTRCKATSPAWWRSCAGWRRGALGPRRRPCTTAGSKRAPIAATSERCKPRCPR